MNESLNAKLYEVEKKREKGILLDKKIAKLPDGQERRKLIYQKQQQDNYNRRHKKFPIDEERALHESYQIIMKVNQNIKKIPNLDCVLNHVMDFMVKTKNMEIGHSMIPCDVIVKSEFCIIDHGMFCQDFR